VTWIEFARARPDLAEAGRELFYKFGVGLGYLATVRKDGAPRLHPVCPLIVEGGLYMLVIPSRKRDDLRRDGRCALHSFPTTSNEDAFALTGRASIRDDAALRQTIDAVFLAERDMRERPPGFDEQDLFELHIDTCLLTRTKGHGDWEPRHTFWKAP
jgi:hypothetical protein